MKLLFICGSLEPGRDGVGDYTMRLAVALIKKGNSVYVVALNDPHVNNIVYGVQYKDGVEGSVLRIPLKFGDRVRYLKVFQLISDFRPDLISLQFVLYSFHRKGLP